MFYIVCLMFEMFVDRHNAAPGNGREKSSRAADQRTPSTQFEAYKTNLAYFGQYFVHFGSVLSLLTLSLLPSSL